MFDDKGFDDKGFDYTGKNVVVVGGTSGINLQVAIQFASAGANVAVASRSIDKVNAAVITEPS